MTRFKELARIQKAIEHKTGSELRWAQWYCGMRVQVAIRKQNIQYWRAMQRKVDDVIRELKPESEAENT